MAATDSLVIADLFELMGAAGGVQSDIPELVNAAGIGAKFQLLSPESTGQAAGAGSTWSLGAPQPTVDIVQTLLLDGERPFGARSSNRTITLPIKITAPDQITLTAARELLMQVTDAPTFTMTWTPTSSGLPMVFDCFRALPAVYSYGFLQSQPIPVSIITLTFQALPYGRNEPTTLQQTAFSSPIIGGVTAGSPVVLDNFTAVSGTNWTQSSSQFVVGPKSARYTPPLGEVYPWLTASYVKTGLSANITGLTVLSVWLGQSFDTGNWGVWPAFKSNVTLRWSITDNASHKLTFSKSINAVPWSATPSTPKWTRISAPIPKSSVFNFGNVTGYTLTMTNWTGGGKSSWVRMNAWLDAVTANPPSLANPASQRGVVYNIMGTAGTARTPISAQFQLPQSGAVSQELSGIGQVWWPPVGVTSVQVECIGAGGAGGARTTSGLGGGGGGGEYAAEPALTVAPGTPVPFSCGTGGQSGASQQVLTFTNAGVGSWVCPTGVTTIKAECVGGGGQGASGGGGGGGGEYAAEGSLAVTAGNTYKFTVGKAGFNTQFGFGNAGNGSNTTFAGDSVTVTAHGGLMPKSGGTVAGVGGSGSANTTHHNGGSGGTSPSYGGGGGGGSGGSASAGNTGGNGSGNSGGSGAAAVTGGGAGGQGAFNPGFPLQGAVPGGGGGGGATTSGVNQNGVAGGNGSVTLTYTVAGGSPVNGTSTFFGSTVSTGGVIVTAHGGQSVALNTTTGGTGGTGSSNTTHFNGGAGGLGGTDGGGGGGSGGSASVGTAGTAGSGGGTGAAAVTGGGKGANGSVTAGTAGDSAALGGGGGGADSTGTSVSGGSGGTGSIVVTWTPPLAPFNTLVAHRPGAQSPPELNPCVPIGNTADSPAGIQYTVPSLVPGVNALFNGTYTVVLVNYNWDSPTTSRAITVTVNQFEYVGGNNYPLSVTRTLTPATDIVNGIVIMGELTLPVKVTDPSNTSGYFTVSISDTDLNDQFLDVLFLDTQGSTVLVNIPGSNTYSNFYIDEPTPDRDLGLILGSDLDRSQAISVMDSAIISGTPFYIVPGDNLFLAYTVNGAPNLGVSYLNRWYLERLS